MNGGIKVVLGLGVSVSLIISFLLPGCDQTPSASGTESPAIPPPVTQPSDNKTKAPPSESPLSTEDPYHWTDTIVKSDLIVLGTITDFKFDVVQVGEGERAGKQVYTIFTLSIEKVIKGEPVSKEVFIRVVGGMIGNSWVTRVPQGPYFDVTDRILIGLRQKEGNVYTTSEYDYPGTFWMASSNFTLKESMLVPQISTSIKLDIAIGRIIVLMKANNIPVVLPQSEWPPLPARPGKILPESRITPIPEPPKNSP